MFKTISKPAEIPQAGDLISLPTGIYRERCTEALLERRTGVGLQLRKFDFNRLAKCEIMARHGFSVLDHGE